MKQWIGYLSTSRNFMIQLERGSCIIFLLCFVSSWTGKAKKKCLNATYNRVRVGKHLSDMFPARNGLKQGYGLSPWIFNVALEYVIRRVQVN